MSEQRFTIQKASGMYLHLPIFDNDVEMADGDVCILLNEQQATITELERKLNKYAKIGEEQLKQIMELQDLCGQSDSENAKLRQEIKKLKQQRV